MKLRQTHTIIVVSGIANGTEKKFASFVRYADADGTSDDK